ncbi:unnamed protein product, partial [Polarella glacialis]
RAFGDVGGAQAFDGGMPQADGKPKAKWRRPPPFPLLSKEPPVLFSPSSEEEPLGELLADVKYSQDLKTLLVGEANFTFAAALCKRFEDCTGLTATSYESREEVLDRFGGAVARRLEELENRLCGVHHAVSVSDLAERFRQGSFDCVAFNFPLVAPKAAATETEAAVSRGETLKKTHRDLSDLLVDFFRGASHVLRPGGECHLRLTDQHITARGLKAAEPFGLTLISRIDFAPAFERVYHPLGYRPVVVVSGKSQKASVRSGFDVTNSSTFVFRRARDQADFGA